MGSTNPIALSVGGAQYNQGVRIWIDMDASGTYEPTESVFATSGSALSHSGNIIIPGVGSTAAPVRMRVMCTYNSVASDAQACTSNLNTYGETEDFLVQLVGSCDATTTVPMTVASNLGNAITTSWPSVSGGSWYEFRYKETASATWIFGGTLGGAATSKTFSGLTPSTSYDLDARVHCTGGVAGAWSSITEVTNAASGCGLAPATSAASSGTSATISWPAVAGAGYYQFRYKETVSATWISGGTAGAAATSKSYNGLTPGTSYDFEARTFCTNGVASAWGAIVFTTSALAGCELAPTLDLTATVTNTSIQISWPSVAGAAWYGFQYKESSSATWINGGTAGAAATAKTYSGLTPGVSYDFQARTYCSNGIPSAWSAMASYTTSGGAARLITSTDKVEAEVVYKSSILANHATNVYPNPATDRVNIEIYMDATNTNTVVQLMDMSGRIVQSNTIQTVAGMNTIVMDMNSVAEGMFMLVIYQNGSLLHTSKLKKN